MLGVGVRKGILCVPQEIECICLDARTRGMAYPRGYVRKAVSQTQPLAQGALACAQLVYLQPVENSQTGWK